MPSTVFFSWQADTPTREGRNFIERALERAVARISDDTAIEEPEREIQIDRDTKNVPGSPPIVDTIFRKIDQAAVFLPDLTFIGKRPDGRPTPNPNVLIEYGWALKQMGHGRIVPVMNTAFGEPSDAMPFDLRHLRNPITYRCPPDLDEANRKKVRDQLARDLEYAIRLVLDSQEFRDSLAKLVTPPAYVPKVPVEGPGRFRRSDEPIGLTIDFMRPPRKVRLSGHPAAWFRMMPNVAPNRIWTVDELEKAMNSPPLPLLSDGWAGYDFLRSPDGYGIYALLQDQDVARAIVFGFSSGEVWSIDTYWLEPKDGKRNIPNVDVYYRRALVAYADFLQKLGISPPFGWIAGMENLKGCFLYRPSPPNTIRLNMSPDGECLVDVVCESGTYSPSDSPGQTLKPFFARLYAACGVSRQTWQDT